MKQKKQRFNPYGLRSRLALSLGASLLICVLVFCVLYNTMGLFLSNYVEQSDFKEAQIQKQAQSLQDYVDKNSISSSDLQQLKKWENRQPVILLELFSGGNCIYSSFYDVPEAENPFEQEVSAKEGAIALRLADMEVEAVLYSDFTYQYYMLGTVLSVIISLVLFVLLFLNSNRKMIRYIRRLNEEVQILEGGNLEYQVSVEGNDEITDLAKSMNRMRESFQQQMDTEQKLHQANRRLITEMSHDLRTPLTGILLYLEILRSNRYKTSAELQDYLAKIDDKARQMKLISDHLFEYSLDDAAGEQEKPQTMEQAFGKAVNSLTDDLSARGFKVVSELAWPQCLVQVTGEYIQRIFENIISNIGKYAEPTADINITTLDADKYCGISVLNTCSPLKAKTESSGIGVDSIRTMMRQMNGRCTVEQTETAFEISLLFPKR